MARRVIVTGATGFLGRHLSPLLDGEYDLVLTTRGFNPGMVHVDDYAHIPDGDVLIHLAETADRGSVNQAGDVYVDLSTNLVQHLCERFEGRIIYASSGAVYGDKNPLPYGIDAPVICVDAYSTTKIRSEELVLSAGGTVVRLANLFGRGMSQGNVLSDIFRQAPGNGPLFVRDDTPVRDFLSVDDAATIFKLLTRSRLPGIFNAGSGVGISIRQLALMALALSGGSRRAILATYPRSDISINVLDISKTVEALNWAPSLSIENYMSEFFRKS